MQTTRLAIVSLSVLGLLGCATGGDLPPGDDDDGGEAGALVARQPPGKTGEGATSAVPRPDLDRPRAAGRSVSILFADFWTEGEVPEGAATTFSLAATADLVAYLYFDGYPDGVYLAWIRYWNPGGALYQENPIAFAIGPSQQESVQVAGLLTPVWVRATMAPELGARVEEILPVAGTDISQYGLTGAWKAELLGEDRSAPPVAVETFTFEE
jgi:hypothetical protein